MMSPNPLNPLRGSLRGKAVIGPAIAFAVPAVSVTEGNSGTQTVTSVINVTRNGVAGALVVNLTYAGTATAGSDYATPPTSVTIASGANSASFDLTINGDTTYEPDETIIITAALAAYPAATAAKTITILNDDAQPPTYLQLTVNKYNLIETGTSSAGYNYESSIANPYGFYGSSLDTTNDAIGTTTNGTTIVPTTGIQRFCVDVNDLPTGSGNPGIALGLCDASYPAYTVGQQRYLIALRQDGYWWGAFGTSGGGGTLVSSVTPAAGDTMVVEINNNAPASVRVYVSKDGGSTVSTLLFSTTYDFPCDRVMFQSCRGTGVAGSKGLKLRRVTA